jgi:hypothetical protein
MIKVSSAYAELLNLINAAVYHRANCQHSDCGVALYQLGLTAKRLVDHCWLSERNSARRIIAETDWS